MAYVTPVTDRNALDIANKTSKAYFNVADWERVYNNARLVNSLVNIIEILTIPFVEIATPTITTIPTVTDINTLAEQIEELRVNSQASNPTAIKFDYEAGARGTAPKYTDINLWESTLDAIWNYYDGDDLEVCPTLTGNLTITTGATAIYVDCIDAANFDIDIQGTGNLYII